MLIIPANSASASGFAVDNSCRFNDGSSDNLTKSFGSSGNLKTWTFSAWFKLSLIPPNSSRLFSIGTYLSGPIFSIFFTTGDLRIENDTALANTLGFRTDQVFRDPSAWSNLVIACDTTQGTEANRFKIYHNGSQITSFSTEDYPSLNTDTYVNSTTGSATIGARADSPSGTYFDGYMSEVVIIDGQQLTPTDFGEFDEDSGIWKPIDVSGLTFGTNGFYLDFKDSSALGDDVSGNGNDFTVNNLTAIDQTTDTPTNNYCTMNPLRTGIGGTLTLSEGNLSATKSGTGTWFGSYGTMGVAQGKWYYEIKFTSASGIDEWVVGWGATEIFTYANETRNIVGYTTGSGGEVYVGKTSTDSTAADYGTFANGDIIGIALNLDDEQITIYKNGSALLTDFDYTAVGTVPYDTNGYVTPKIAHKNTGSVSVNFGNPPYSISSGNADGNSKGNFEYLPPEGYFALCTANLAEFG